MAKLIRSRGVPLGFFAPVTARSVTGILGMIFFLCPVSFLLVIFYHLPDDAGQVCITLRLPIIRWELVGAKIRQNNES